MKDLDYGKDYRYAHKEQDAYAVGETYFPNEIELKIGEKLNHLREQDRQSGLNRVNMNQPKKRKSEL